MDTNEFTCKSCGDAFYDMNYDGEPEDYECGSCKHDRYVVEVEDRFKAAREERRMRGE